MDKVPVERVAEFERGLTDYVRTRHAGLIDEIESTGSLPDREALGTAIDEYAQRFLGE